MKKNNRYFQREYMSLRQAFPFTTSTPFIILLFIFFTSITIAQNGVGINTVTPQAMLDIVSTSSGILIPRMTDAQKNAISSPPTASLVYQTDGIAGFYYYTGSAWIPFLSSATGWSLTGNAGTTAGTNFIGTTDAQDFVVKTNNTEKVRVFSNGNMGIGTSTDIGYRLDITGETRINAGSLSFTSMVSGGGVFMNTSASITSGIGWWANSTRTMGISQASSSGIPYYAVRLPGDGDARLFYPNRFQLLNHQIDLSNGSGSRTALLINQTVNGSLAIDVSNGSSIFGSTSGSVGIGTNTSIHSSAILDITSTAKGALLPRMTAAQIAVISSPATGLLAFQTDGASGFYYYDGTQWRPLLSNSVSSAGGWNLTGNAGTTAGTNFIGTTDAVDFVVKTNNTEKVRILSGGNVGIGTTAPSRPLDVYSTVDYQGGIRVTNPGGGWWKDAYEAYGINNGRYVMNCIDCANNPTINLPSNNSAGGRLILGSNTQTWSVFSYINDLIIRSSLSSGKIGINTSLPEAILDIVSTSSGILIPRMTSAQRVAISSPPTASLVYQTDGTAGFYYYNGAAWLPLLNNTTGWNTTGNTGTTAGTNFIGTNDAVDFVIKTNNAENVRLTNAGNLLIGTSTDNSYKLDVNGTSIFRQDVYCTKVFKNHNQPVPTTLTTSRGISLLTTISVDNGVIDIGEASRGMTMTMLESGGGTVDFYFKHRAVNTLTDRFYFDLLKGQYSITGNFTQSSANGDTYTGIAILPTINQTLTANGNVRGFYYNPTITSILGSHIAFQNTRGDVLLGTTSGSVGIGANTTINSSAILDITSTAKGALLPRMTIAQIAAISSPATGLLAFQTDGASGFYYYDGTQWRPLLSNSVSSAGGWNLTGNAGTTAGTNFIGTTDAVDFVIKTNNIEKARVLSNGNILIGTTTDNVTNKLQINGQTYTRGLISNTANMGQEHQLEIQGTNGAYNAGIKFSVTNNNNSGVFNLNNAAGYLTYRTSSDNVSFTERIRIQQDGAFLINTTSPNDNVYSYKMVMLPFSAGQQVESGGFMISTNQAQTGQSALLSVVNYNNTDSRSGGVVQPKVGGYFLQNTTTSATSATLQNARGNNVSHVELLANNLTTLNQQLYTTAIARTNSSGQHINSQSYFYVHSSGTQGSLFDAIGYWSRGQLVFSSGTAPVITQLSDFKASNIVGIANGTITTRYGLLLDYDNTNTTNAWGVYQLSNTIKNHFNGNVLIGTATDAGYKLDVNGMARINNTVTASANNFHNTLLSSTLTATATVGDVASNALISSTLTAGANNQLLNVMQLSGNFSTGAFTGVRKNYVYAKASSTTDNLLFFEAVSGGSGVNLSLSAPPSSGSAWNLLATQSAINITAVNSNGYATIGTAGGGGLYTDPNNVSMRYGPGGCEVIGVRNNYSVEIGAGLNLTYGFNWTSGTNTANQINIKTPINATGGTNVFRGIYYNPNLISLTGTTHIAFENTTGNILLNTSSGNTGIGNSSPKAKLHIYNSSAYNTSDTPTGQDHILIEAPTTGAGTKFGGITWHNTFRRRASICATQENADEDYIGIAFHTQGIDGPGNFSESMRISHSGNVGIGTASPNNKLDVAGDVSFARIGGTTLTFQTPATDARLFTSGGNPLLLNPSDDGDVQIGNGDFYVDVSISNVGIGTTAPSEKLEVCGNLKVVGTINASGVINASQAITCSSDLRFKKDIKPLSNVLNNVQLLNGVNYNWRSDEYKDKGFDDKLQIGVIAQEVEKVYPELVFTDSKGFKSVDYAKFTPILIEAIKQQQQQLDADRSTINELKAALQIQQQSLQQLIEKVSFMENKK